MVIRRIGRCHAVICLNKYGKMARANEHVEYIVPCRCVKQFWSPEDNSYICASCWTPAKLEEEVQRATG